MITKIVKIIHELIGYLSGIILYYIWCFIIILSDGNFFFIEEIINHTIVRKSIISSLAFSWLKFGFAGVFMIGGHYLIYSILMGEIERIRDIKMMKYIFLANIIWVFIGVIIDLSDLYIPDIYVYGGFLINVFVIFYFGRIPITHNKSNQVDQSD